MYQIDNFKISASQCGEIMGQKALGKTGLSYVEKWIKQQLYGRTKEIYSKHMDKGNAMEHPSIEYLSGVLDWGLVSKNQERFSNEYMQGTPDIILSDRVVDVKNSWDCFTFPLFCDDVPNSDYYHQLQCYMDLTGKDKAELIYVLMDAPEHLIDVEAWNESKRLGEMEVTIEIHDMVRERMTYSNLPDSLRIKRFEIERDDEVINKIYSRVDECRDVVKQLIQSL